MSDLGFVPLLACVAGPQFYGGLDLQRAGFWRARGRINKERIHMDSCLLFCLGQGKD